MLKINFVPDPVLTSEAKPVIKIDKKIQRLASEMAVILSRQRNPEGVGLAAPQVGLPLRLFIIKTKKNAPTETFINPEIIASVKNKTPTPEDAADSDQSAEKLEGCLSIPRIWGHVKRDYKIKVSYTNIDSQKITQWFTGFKALVIQHEVDHLNGILFTRRAVEQRAKLFKEVDGELVDYQI